MLPESALSGANGKNGKKGGSGAGLALLDFFTTLTRGGAQVASGQQAIEQEKLKRDNIFFGGMLDMAKSEKRRGAMIFLVISLVVVAALIVFAIYMYRRKKTS